MGYSDMNMQYPFVVRAYEDERAAMEIARTYDVAIIGNAPLEYLQQRMKKNLLTFRFCERSLKKGTWRRFIPRTRKKIQEGYIKYKDQNLYILGASSFTAADLVLCGFDLNKCLEWGYFPEVEQKNLDELFQLKRKNTVPEILYAGRLLKLKHVMDTVKAVQYLVKRSVEVHFTIIGDGESTGEIKRYIQKNHLERYITMLPFMTPQEVRTYMERADIYVFGSNFYEGWGAVVNESMNSACAVIVSHAVGSAAHLIENGVNGFIYPFADVKKLTEILNILVLDKNLREKIGRNAYKTLTQLWNSEVAAERFLMVCNAIICGEEYGTIYDEGPCRPARLFKNNWIGENNIGY
ncbi:MAG: glycosyltransferase [Clostridia bacterium]|nr:glycosyltransferase [Clostridia bacterium]